MAEKLLKAVDGGVHTPVPAVHPRVLEVAESRRLPGAEAALALGSGTPLAIMTAGSGRTVLEADEGRERGTSGDL